MKDRRALQEELNRINELYQQKDLELRKAGGSDAQRQQMRDMLNAKKESLMAEMGDDLQKLNTGKSIKISDAPKFSKLASMVGKKAVAAIPFAGAAYGLASGDPAMAAEEAAGDVPVLGQIYEAVKPETAGNASEERDIMNEIKARNSYRDSQARRDFLQGPTPQKPAADEDEAMTDEIMNARQQALKRIRGY